VRTPLTGFAFALGLALSAPVAMPRAEAATDPVERMDPPSWWVGFDDPKLEILVHGRDGADLSATVEYPGVRLAATTRLESRNYLVLTLFIEPDARPGALPIRFSRDGKLVAERRYTLAARRAGSRERQGFDQRDVIYLIVPDRFANGDPSNDHPPGTADKLDRAQHGARHGGDLAGVAAHLDYLEGMGFTQLWLTPVLENAQPAYSYHGYAITDHYRVDPRFGSNAEYAQMSAAARAHGLGLIQDIVVNHIGSKHWWMRDLPSKDWINGDVNGPRTNHMHTSILDPHSAQVDRDRFTRGWFDTVMPDLNTTNPWLAQYLIEHALWWIEFADLAGLRMDTYSYSDKQFMADFTGRVMREYPRLNIVGEEWRSDPAAVSYWQAGKLNWDGYQSHLPSLMDFPTVFALLGALTKSDSGQGGLNSLYEVLGDDFLYANPRNLVVFADNHDTDRVFTVLGRDYDLWRMAMVFVATMRGIPEFTYGTEILMANDPPKDDGDVRRDFPGGWKGDAVDAFAGRGLAPAAAKAQQFLRTLLTWRKGSPAAQAGELKHYAPENGVYVYFRRLGAETVMVAFNKSAKDVNLDLGRFRESLARGVAGRDVMSGARVELNDALAVPARGVILIDMR
jgi:neopullulanase